MREFSIRNSARNGPSLHVRFGSNVREVFARSTHSVDRTEWGVAETAMWQDVACSCGSAARIDTPQFYILGEQVCNRDGGSIRSWIIHIRKLERWIQVIPSWHYKSGYYD